MAESIIREDGERVVIEEVAMETLGAMDAEPLWFHMPNGWEIDGDTATALLATFTDDGEVGPERFRLTMTIKKEN